MDIGNIILGLMMIFFSIGLAIGVFNHWKEEYKDKEKKWILKI